MSENQQSHQNYDVLMQLKDGQDMMANRFEKFSSDQEIENKLLHGRIDATQEKFMSGFGILKDAIAERGRITTPLIAIIVSVLTLLSGAGAAYIGMRLEPIDKTVTANSSKISQSELERDLLAKDLQSVAIAAKVAETKAGVDRKWVGKLLDEVRSRDSEKLK